MKFIALFLAGSLLASCSSATPQTKAVRTVTSEGALTGCKFLASVRGDQNLYGGALFARAAYDDAINQMKAKAAEAGGNTLFIGHATTGMMGANAMGDAYNC